MSELNLRELDYVRVEPFTGIVESTSDVDTVRIIVEGLEPQFRAIVPRQYVELIEDDCGRLQELPEDILTRER